MVLLLFFSFHSLQAQVPPNYVLEVPAPQTFRAVFITTKGEFVIEANRSWSPQGVDRLYQLIISGFYNNCLFFRVEKNYVIQFGIAAAEPVNRFWDPKKMKDEPILHKNLKGTISFASGKQNDRSTQIFINMQNNPKLDTMMHRGAKGFTPVARIISGMEIAEQLNGRYGKQPATVQDSLYKYGNPYFEKHFPGLDRIIKAEIIR